MLDTLGPPYQPYQLLASSKRSGPMRIRDNLLSEVQPAIAELFYHFECHPFRIGRIERSKSGVRYKWLWIYFRIRKSEHT